MNKLDLIDDVASATGETVATVRSVMDAILDAVVRTLSSGGEVRLFGIGRLYLSHRVPRPARNLHTGEVVFVPSRKVVMLRPSKPLQRAVNKG